MNEQKTDSEAINFCPRGIGCNCLPCFICGEGDGKVQPDMASFVDSKEDGLKAVEMLGEKGLKAILDYRPSEPKWIQVKIGACEKHKQSLETLMELIRAKSNKLIPEIIEKINTNTIKEENQDKFLGYRCTWLKKD